MADRITLREGEITLGSGSERYILIPLRAYAAIVNAIYRLTGPAAGGPLYYIGKMIGYGLVEELEQRLGRNPGFEEAVAEYARFLEKLGFGRVVVEETTPTRLVLLLESPPSTQGAKLLGGAALELARKNRGCYIEAGMLAGALEKLLSHHVVARQVESSETQCRIVVEKA